MASAPSKSYRSGRRRPPDPGPPRAPTGPPSRAPTNHSSRAQNPSRGPGPQLDPNAAVFQPYQGMDYNDLMYYNYGSGYENENQAYDSNAYPTTTGYQGNGSTGYQGNGTSYVTSDAAGYYDGGYYYTQQQQYYDQNYNAPDQNAYYPGGYGGSSRGQAASKSYSNSRPRRGGAGSDVTAHGYDHPAPPKEEFKMPEDIRKNDKDFVPYQPTKLQDSKKGREDSENSGSKSSRGGGKFDKRSEPRQTERRFDRRVSREEVENTKRKSGREAEDSRNQRRNSREMRSNEASNGGELDEISDFLNRRYEESKNKERNSRNRPRKDDRRANQDSGREVRNGPGREFDRRTNQDSGREPRNGPGRDFDRGGSGRDFDRRPSQDFPREVRNGPGRDYDRRPSQDIPREVRNGPGKDFVRRNSSQNDRRRNARDSDGRNSPRDGRMGKSFDKLGDGRKSPRDSYKTDKTYENNVEGRKSPSVSGRMKQSFDKREEGSEEPERMKDFFSANDEDPRPMPQAKKREDFDFRAVKTSGTGTEALESQRGLLIEELMNSTYECMVCCDVIRREVAVWSCGECYHVFHLYCIKKWARSPSALVEGTETGWRCPGCQNVTLKVPNVYICFCSKQKDPQFSPYETPHSCGEVCGRKRGGHCTHSCNILCHPGPCPSCNSSINKFCECGKTNRTVRCSQGAEVKCDKKCAKSLNCGKHSCERVCHAGGCEPCADEIEQTCFCGKGSRTVICGSKESFVKQYVCGEICGKKLSCGNHDCQKTCHDYDCDPCVLAPDKVEFCCCGKTKLSEISDSERESCTDPIPNCTKPCDKELACGPEAQRHRCSAVCHQGSCRVCEDGTTPISCRCEATVREMSCQDAEKYLNGTEQFLCTRRCNKKKQCGRHKCQNACCTDKEHSCTQTCGRKLTCGLHRCEEPCHRGNCQNCWNVNFDEVSCHCGASVLDPPIPCGTKPPECIQICQRRHDCEHQVRHNCHSEEKCPPCTELTKKMCLGGHEMRHNIPCHIQEISCGLPCGKPLSCKQHKCIKICHKGECVNDDEVCEQRCKKPRAWCDHICGAPCHPGLACPETQCDEKVDLKCVCGLRSEYVTCAAGKRDAQAKIFQQMTNSAMIGKILYVGNGQSVDLNSMNAKKRQLECNEECAKTERNRRLALALQIENPNISDKLGAPNYPEFLKEFAKLNPAFAAEIEKALSDLVQNAKSSKYPNRSHSFKPMKRDQRRFIHEIAEFYGCKTQAYDYEPVKSVVATAYKGKCWMPNMTLTAAIKRQTQPSAPLPIPHNSTEKDIRAKSAAARRSTTVFQTLGEDSTKTKKVAKSKFVDYFDFDED